MGKSNILGLVRDTAWNGFLELNRLAFSEALPRNSESRALSIALRMIKKHYPHIEWVISFADGCQCGDGTIYRAAGFVLTGIKLNKSLLRLPDGSVTHKMTQVTGTIRCGISIFSILRRGRGSLAKKSHMRRSSVAAPACIAGLRVVSRRWPITNRNSGAAAATTTLQLEPTCRVLEEKQKSCARSESYRL